MTVIVRKNTKNTQRATFSEVDLCLNRLTRSCITFFIFMSSSLYVSTASTRLSSILLPTRTIGKVITVIKSPIAAGYP